MADRDSVEVYIYNWPMTEYYETNQLKVSCTEGESENWTSQNHCDFLSSWKDAQVPI